MNAQVESGISMAVGIASLIGSVGTIFVGYIVLRIQRDMAQLENKILAGINGKYISRKEHDILCRDHEAIMTRIETKGDNAREQHHILHEEFIGCRAAHMAKE